MSADVIDLNRTRLDRGMSVPVLPSEVFAPPAGKRIGDRVFLMRHGVYGIVATATRRRGGSIFGEWTLRINVDGVTYSVGDGAVEPAPESPHG